jgi:hypothetical protein
LSAARALFAEEDQARAVGRRLLADGFAVDVRRAPFAGEDDDEAHAWAVDTDAPVTMLELLAEDHEGWVEYDEGPTTRPDPLDLPRAPRTRHRNS